MELQNLLVVIDPNQPSHPALDRAAWLARQTAARLHLLLVEYNAALDGGLLENAFQDQARAALLEQRGLWLDELVAPLREEGLQLHADIRWSKRLHETTLDKVAELKPDLVLKSATHNNLLRRLLLNDSCWQLMRQCHAPLWLVHQTEWRGRKLCAALDPLHSADQPAALDHRIIRTALGLCDELGMHADYLHCHVPLPRTLLVGKALLDDYQQYAAQQAQQHRQAFDRLIGQYPIQPQDAQLFEGQPEELLPRFVRQNDIDLLVMGATARGRLDTALIGHTAERIFESVDCDLLLIKAEPVAGAS